MKDYKWKEIQVGMQESFTVEITEEMQGLFTRLSNDVNPLHLNSKFAKKRGFQDRVVYGMLINSFYSTLVGVYLPGKNCLFHEINARFTKPVYIGDRITVVGTVKDIRESTGRIKLSAEIRKENEMIVNKATLVVGMTQISENLGGGDFIKWNIRPYLYWELPPISA